MDERPDQRVDGGQGVENNTPIIVGMPSDDLLNGIRGQLPPQHVTSFDHTVALARNNDVNALRYLGRAQVLLGLAEEPEAQRVESISDVQPASPISTENTGKVEEVVTTSILPDANEPDATNFELTDKELYEQLATPENPDKAFKDYTLKMVMDACAFLHGYRKEEVGDFYSNGSWNNNGKLLNENFLRAARDESAVDVRLQANIRAGRIELIEHARLLGFDPDRYVNPYLREQIH